MCRTLAVPLTANRRGLWIRMIWAPWTESVVYVVDDDLQARTALKGLMESVGLCCEVSSSPAEFALAKRSEKVSCLILDVRLQELGAFPLQAELARERPHMPIIMMSANASIRMAVEAIKGGAVDFFAKPYRDQDLLEAIQWALVRAHRSRQRETTMRNLLKQYYNLSPREKQVMLLVCDGLSGKQIAHKLGVAEITAKVHRRNMMKKLRADSIPALVRMADAIEAEDGNGQIFLFGGAEARPTPVPTPINNEQPSAGVQRGRLVHGRAARATRALSGMAIRSETFARRRGRGAADDAD